VQGACFYGGAGATPNHRGAPLGRQADRANVDDESAVVAGETIIGLRSTGLPKESTGDPPG